jgi:hypothetical protein
VTERLPAPAAIDATTRPAGTYRLRGGVAALARNDAPTSPAIILMKAARFHPAAIPQNPDNVRQPVCRQLAPRDVGVDDV